MKRVLILILPLTLLFLTGCEGCSREPVLTGPSDKEPNEITEPKPEGNAKIYPFLKDYDWSEKSTSLYANYLDSDKPPVPLIAYALGTPENPTFLTPADLEETSLEVIHAEAMKNIEAYPYEFEPFSDYMIGASGSELSVEKILSKSFLIAAQEELGASEIMVCIPRRTVMYIGNAEMPAESLEEFIYVSKYTMLDDSYGNEFITNLLFKFKDGELSSVQILEIGGV